MPAAEARIATGRPSRYLVQFCRHAAAMHRTGLHRSRVGHGSSRPPRAHEVQVHAEWSDTRGVVEFAAWGRCVLQAGTDTLVLHVEADTEENLRRLQDAISRDFSRFGRSNRLTVSWQPIDNRAIHPDADPGH